MCSGVMRAWYCTAKTQYGSDKSHCTGLHARPLQTSLLLVESAYAMVIMVCMMYNVQSSTTLEQLLEHLVCALHTYVNSKKQKFSRQQATSLSYFLQELSGTTIAHTGRCRKKSETMKPSLPSFLLVLLAAAVAVVGEQTFTIVGSATIACTDAATTCQGEAGLFQGSLVDNGGGSFYVGQAAGNVVCST